MGICRFCGQSAGTFRTVHRECKERYSEAVLKVRGFFVTSLESKMDANAFSHGIRSIMEAARVPKSEAEGLILSGFKSLIDRALDDHVLSAEEENRIVELCDAFDLSLERVQDVGLQRRLLQGRILRDLQERSPKSRLQVTGSLPFVLQKTEVLIWVFQDVDYYTMKERVQYVGGSAGVSVRVVKGVYLRAGGYKGERVSTQSLELQDRGTVGITSKHVYFKGAQKAFRITLTKLISVERFADGIGIMKDGANPKLQVLAVDDPWFASNILAQI